VIGIREEALVEESPARDALEMRLAAAEAERDAALRGAAVGLKCEEAALRRVAELEAMLAAREELGVAAAAHAPTGTRTPHRHHVVAGIHVVQPDTDELVQRAKEGYRLLAYSLDITMVLHACTAGVEKMRSHLAG